MKTWIQNRWKAVNRRSLIVPVLALALAASFATYELCRPEAARAAVSAPAAAPLDASSVSPLLALDNAMEAVAARVTPAVVNVAVTSRNRAELTGSEGPNTEGPNEGPNMDQLPPEIQRFFRQFGQGMQPQAPQVEHGIGSGVLISPNGYIVTNNHVVNGAVDIRVTTSDQRVWKAKLVGTDPLTDLAVLKIDGDNLPSIPWGDSNALRPGQTVLAFGNPMGLRFTVTRGIVSALNRPNPFSDNAHKPGGFIQTDAAINPGNSGGALVDARGEVVGINTFLISSTGGFSGMGFAIPSQTARPVVDSLMQYGKVNHAYIGIGITDVTPENAKFFDLKDSRGALVTQVDPDSPGAQAGLKVGDVIRQLDGKPVADAGQLQSTVLEKQPDSRITLQVLRDGKEMSVPLTLAALGSHNAAASGSAGEQQGKGRWGIGISDITPDLRQQLQVPGNVHGAVVERVVPGSPADNSGLSQGDVIEQVNHQNTQSAADVQRALSAAPQGKDALVLVWSKGGSTFRVMHAPDAG